MEERIEATKKDDKRSLEQKVEQDVLSRLNNKEKRLVKELLGEYNAERRERMRLTLRWMKMHTWIEKDARTRVRYDCPCGPLCDRGKEE
jgi:hypothetical protein